MPIIKIDNKTVISYDHTSRTKYWTALSDYLIKKHTKRNFHEQGKVEEILIDGFSFLVANFKRLISSEKDFTFFKYIYFLHEQSIQIYKKTLSGFKLKHITENEFAIYRRTLKLILEQGCDIDLEWGKFKSSKYFLDMNEKIQELLYLSTWMYHFADYIAFQKMVEECHQIHFDEENLLVIDWQHHYGQAYSQLFPSLIEDYKTATFDRQAIFDLRAKLEECFDIKYDFAVGIIFEIQKHHNPTEPNSQTIDPHVLPENLVKNFGISYQLAETFYRGLTISRDNKLSIEDAILKPHSTKRYMFRPILVYKIGGEDRALVGIEKFSESIMVLSTNAIHWNAMYEEWLTLKCIQSFITNKGNEHDKILEDKIEDIVRSKGLVYCRNIKSFKQPLKRNNVRIDNELAGEIDLIVVNPSLKKIIVGDAKYNRSRYEGVGYRTDFSNFINSYEPQLDKKVNWISENRHILQEHLKIVFKKFDLDLTGYEVEGIFIINTPTFYMFNGNFKAITLKQFDNFIDGIYEYPDLSIVDAKGKKEIKKIKHPYFKKL